MEKLFFRIGWGTIIALAAFLFGTTALYFSFAPDYNFLLEKQDLVEQPIWRTAFYFHIGGGMLALLFGPFQFSSRLRRRQRVLHRSFGKLYVAAILFIAGPSGLYMAFHAEGGFWGQAGFVIMALLWIWSTYRAYDTVRKRDFMGHMTWMTRSYALTFAAVTLRLYVPIASLWWGISEEMTVMTSAWVSWIPNLIAAEFLLVFFPQRL